MSALFFCKASFGFNFKALVYGQQKQTS